MVENRNNHLTCSYKADGDPCMHPVTKNKTVCIFHDPDPNKDEVEFERALKLELTRQNVEHKYSLDLSGFIIPIDIDFDSLTWEGLTRFSARNTKFLKAFTAAYEDLNVEVDFSGAAFNDVDFAYSSFRKNVFFSYCNFLEGASFEHSVFIKDCYFDSAKFHKLTDFASAEFTGESDFVNTQFGIESSSETIFDYAKFHETAFFSSSTFLGDVSFDSCLFNKFSYFNNVKFKGVTFDYAKLNMIISTKTYEQVSFVGTDLRNVEFRQIDMKNCSLAFSTGLEQCLFSHVTWPKKSGRWIVFDESNVNWSRKAAILKLQIIERIYRELKVNYENHKNFPDAGHFHFGEMEMRRLAKRGIFRQTVGSLEGWYRILSDYGENWRKALFSFVVIILLCALIYAWQGFAFRPSLSSDLMKEVYLNPELYSYPMHWSHVIGQSIIFSFKVALLRADAFAQSLSPYTTLTIFLESIFGPISLGLLILAVGRKFKRN